MLTAGNQLSDVFKAAGNTNAFDPSKVTPCGRHAQGLPSGDIVYTAEDSECKAYCGDDRVGHYGLCSLDHFVGVESKSLWIFV